MSITAHKELLKLHGRKVSCKIRGKFVDDAKISVDEDIVHICQNEEKYYTAKERLGYDCSIFISSDKEKWEGNCSSVTEIKLLNRG